MDAFLRHHGMYSHHAAPTAAISKISKIHPMGR
jgi:hypothetical protein